MQSRIPLPTDNIYKFYALFGLLIIIFGFGSIVYINKTTNELVYKSMVDLAGLKSIKTKSASESAQQKVVEKKSF